jgi:hypothetical protein
MEAEYATVPEVAQLLRESEKWAWAHVADHRLPGVVRMGRSVRVHLPTLRRRLLSGQVLLDKKYGFGGRNR